MQFILTFIVSLCLLVSFNGTANTLSIKLVKQQLTLNYSQAVRLSQVVIDAHSQTPFEPLTAILSHDKQSDVNELNDQIVSSLSLLSQYSSLFLSEKTFNKAAKQLIAQLSSLTFVERIFTSLDMDFLRINAQANPLLSGNYLLFIKPRPRHISFFGAIDSDKEVTLPLIEHATIDDYLDKLKLLTTADTSIVYVIQPDGSIQLTEYSIWQDTQVFLAPGATVFIPFANLPTKYASLNESIVQLLRNKAL